MKKNENKLTLVKPRRKVTTKCKQLTPGDSSDINEMCDCSKRSDRSDRSNRSESIEI